ncbi:lysophospholipid acyltransferase family protein [Micromonospora halophytica]|uniref:1-acyl-sn-glycerol-3-phosphate acyltransferases n=1 Tax=Micromonospora halophytica TaxID=47864 RepID=A0A1C5GJE3_9ACTN|nr:lysophospholipid acyltransferase family protein [Micromonospora halophytica]SCG33906.1 1-acyl-sn-glycerol-3-phosphate acyltransferases [Micromonospora halophytica]
MSAPLWRPVSGCGPGCLPGSGEAPSVPVPWRVARLLGVLGMLLAGVGLVGLLPVLPVARRAVAVRRWARGAARVLGVRLEVRGRSPGRPALLVANHVSWLDVLAVLAVAPARLLAKSDVRGWPLVGVLARAAGALFVDRARPRELPATVDRLVTALRRGDAVAVFPEGTTWCGTAASRACRPGRGFRPAAFQAAIDAGVPVVPLRLTYRCAATGEATTAAAFLGDETLWASARRVLAARDLVLTVRIGAALHPARGADRRALARAAESAVHLVPARAAAPALPPALPSAAAPLVGVAEAGGECSVERHGRQPDPLTSMVCRSAEVGSADGAGERLELAA